MLASASKVRVVSRNINSFGDDRKTDSIFNYMLRNKADVFVLSDTRTGPEDIPRLQKKWKGVCEFNHLKTNARGIAIFLKDSIAPKNVEITNIIPGNLSYLTFTAFEKRYLIIAIYGPNRDDPEFYQNHVFNVTNFPVHDYVMWAGDWNLVLDQKKDTKNYKGEYNKKARSKVIENIVANNLVDTWRAKYPHKKEFTWHKAVRKINPIAQRARLDFILADEDLASHVKDCGIEQPDKISDHSGTWIEFDTVNFSRGPGLWRFNNSYLDDPEFRDIVHNIIKMQTQIHAKKTCQMSNGTSLP